MPWKLRDPGLKLALLEPELESQRQRLELTFEAVGDTPENKYIIFVDPTSGLINEWQFFTRYDDEAPRFSTPWADYQAYGKILLSGDRGRAKLTDISAAQEVPSSRFLNYE